MERIYCKWEYFTNEGKTCHYSQADFRDQILESRCSGEYIKKVLNSRRGNKWGLTHCVLFFDVKEEDIEKELINSNYPRVTIYK
jgi:hypothetical protein